MTKIDGKGETGGYLYLSENVTITVTETIDDFFFIAIYKWLRNTEHTLVPKELLIRAIECFKLEHPDEFKEISIDCMERFEEWKKNHLEEDEK